MSHPLVASYKRRGLVFWLVMLFVVVPHVLLVVGSVGFFTYLFVPVDLERVAMPVIPDQTRHMILVSHGTGDSPGTWGQELSELLGDGEHTLAVPLDWQAYADNSLRCAVNGRRLGENLGRHIAQHKQIDSVHLIGHSCGSFVSWGVCEAIRETRADVSIQATYLDPVTIYAGVFWDFGGERFGACADFSDVYIDTGDSVPGSNKAFPQAHTFDVTNVRIGGSYIGHAHFWPVEYYLQQARQHNILQLRDEPDLPDEYPSDILQRVAP